MNSHENNAQFGQDRVSDMAKVSVHVICLQKIGGKSGSVHVWLCIVLLENEPVVPVHKWDHNGA